MNAENYNADARAQFEAWAKSSGMDLARSVGHPILIDECYINNDTFCAWIAWQAALAASQAVAQLVGYFDPDVAAHFADGNIDPAGILRRKPNGVSTVPVYIGAPAQGIDLGQFRQPVEFFIAYTFPGTPSHAEGKRLLALISQRDAAPGVG